MDARKPTPTLPRLVAGEVCLDFANTADWHASDHPEESLKSYDDLVAWCRRARLLDGAAAGRLLREARRRPPAAKIALKRAIALREALYRIVVALLHRRPSEPADLDLFNRALAPALARLRVVAHGGGLGWTWAGDERPLDALLWPILVSAAGLMISVRRERIGQCADDRGCGWLFLDTTKNRSRRWCEMGDCGNRAKARRHHERRRRQGKRRRSRPGQAESGSRGSRGEASR